MGDAVVVVVVVVVLIFIDILLTVVEWDRARKWEMLRRDKQSPSTRSNHLSSSFSSFAFCCFVDVVVVVVLLFCC